MLLIIFNKEEVLCYELEQVEVVEKLEIEVEVEPVEDEVDEVDVFF